jgi:septal ring factor EnvC (AmiA/AmiB activator)
MSKKKIIIVAALAVASFAIAMGSSFLLPSGPPNRASARQAAADANEAPPVKLSLQERDLDELVRNLRQRIADCRAQTQQLNEREKQIRIVQDQLARQAQELEDLRVKAATALAALRQEKAAMEAERVKIEAEDRTNLKKTAAIYEKMDAAAGGKILADMCSLNNEDAVVRILYYMSERSAAKTIESLADKKLAARLCDKIKRVREQVQ